MDYLPSKKFLKRAIIITLVLAGWFLFFGEKRNTQTGTLNYTKNWSAYDLEQANFSKMSPWDLTNLTKESVKFPVTIGSSEIKKTITYELKDLTIIKDTSKSSATSYAENVIAALKAYTVPNLPNEADAMLKAFENKDMQEVGKLLVMSEVHKAVAGALFKISVPEDAQLRHLFLLNNIVRLASAVEDMSKILTTPETAFFAIGQYKKETTILPKNISELDSYFEQKGVKLKEKINIRVNGINEI